MDSAATATDVAANTRISFPSDSSTEILLDADNECREFVDDDGTRREVGALALDEKLVKRKSSEVISFSAENEILFGVDIVFLIQLGVELVDASLTPVGEKSWMLLEFHLHRCDKTSSFQEKSKQHKNEFWKFLLPL